jgi:hypothetical protein
VRRVKWLVVSFLIAVVLLIPLEASAGICKGPGLLVVPMYGIVD